MKNKIVKLLQIFLPLILGSISGIIISGSIDYNLLNKPPLSPPSIIFPIMWTTLYLLIGISYYLFKKNTYDNQKETIVHYINVITNILWPILFFTFKLRFFSIIWLFLLIIEIIYLIYLYYQKYKTSSYLLIPYLLWSLFAFYLNIGIYVLN